MDFNIRGAIIQNLAGNSKDELRHTITDAIQSGEEKLLPGLGVLFEMIWNHAPIEEKQEMLNHLHESLQQK